MMFGFERFILLQMDTVTKSYSYEIIQLRNHTVISVNIKDLFIICHQLQAIGRDL